MAVEYPKILTVSPHFAWKPAHQAVGGAQPVSFLATGSEAVLWHMDSYKSMPELLQKAALMMFYHRITEWFGFKQTLKDHSVPAHLPWSRTLSIRSGCSKPSPT